MWVNQYAVQQLVTVLGADDGWQYPVRAAPVLYDGPYDYDVLAALAEGDTIVGGGKHIREGVVVRPVQERRLPSGERMIAKFISEAYLLRKGQTSEFE